MKSPGSDLTVVCTPPTGRLIPLLETLVFVVREKSIGVLAGLPFVPVMPVVPEMPVVPVTVEGKPSPVVVCCFLILPNWGPNWGLLVELVPCPLKVPWPLKVPIVLGPENRLVLRLNVLDVLDVPLMPLMPLEPAPWLVLGTNGVDFFDRLCMPLFWLNDGLNWLDRTKF